MLNEINIEILREDLINYFGTAMYSSSPLAIMNLTEVEKASPNKLIQIAIKNNFDLNNYIEHSKKKTKVNSFFCLLLLYFNIYFQKSLDKTYLSDFFEFPKFNLLSNNCAQYLYNSYKSIFLDQLKSNSLHTLGKAS